MNDICCYYYDVGRNRCKCYVNKNLDELLADNAKLRRLVDGLVFCTETGPWSDECIGCPLLDQSTHDYRCTKEELIRELEI